MRHPILRWCFFALVVRPLTHVVLGLNVRHLERLPASGPAVIAANHNSHLDTLVLMSLFPLALLPRLRPVAAADYFLSNPLLSWFSREIIGIIPLNRKSDAGETIEARMAGVYAGVERGDLLVLFPEGSRGEPEQLTTFRKGIAHLSARYPELPVTPVFLHGLGKALPKGEALLVPFFIDVFVGEALRWGGSTEGFMDQLNGRMKQLTGELTIGAWE